eukprot:5126931-Amphidinium_carterae.11
MQTSPPHSQQSQGVVERYHQTLFAQLRTVKFHFCQQYDCITQLGYSTVIYAIAMGKHPTRETGNDHTTIK